MGCGSSTAAPRAPPTHDDDGRNSDHPVRDPPAGDNGGNGNGDGVAVADVASTSTIYDWLDAVAQGVNVGDDDVDALRLPPAAPPPPAALTEEGGIPTSPLDVSLNPFRQQPPDQPPQDSPGLGTAPTAPPSV